MQGKDVKKLRQEMAVSQERFARLLGVSLQTVRRWEAGLTRPLPIISLKLDELQKESTGARRRKGGLAVDRESEKAGEGIEVGLGGLFKGLGGLFDLVSRMAEEGKGEYLRTGETETLGGKGKAIYGLSLRVGLGGKPVIEQFGNVKATEEGPVVAEVREPLVDVLDEGDHLAVIAELPGVAAEDIHVEINGDVLELTAEAGDRKYSKVVLLPATVDAHAKQSSYKNGILEIRLVKR